MNANLSLITLACSLLLAGAPAFATTAIEGAARASVGIWIGDDSIGDFDEDVVAGLPLATGAVAFAELDLGVLGSISAGSGLDAVWDSAESGGFYHYWGWSIDTPEFFFLDTGSFANWSYSFIASDSGFFRGTYEFAVEGDTFGLNDPYFAGAFGYTPLSPGSGSFSRYITAGNSYTIEFANQGNLAGTVGGPESASAEIFVLWEIAYGAVPEPSSWALMIAGFGAVGFVLRTRRTASA